jgi:radical SAM superfamily enzyme YgiQ (UPF0313 family)
LQKDILLITPPFTQLNTPYPATAYLKGFLNTKNISSFQADLGIDVILNLFSKNGLIQLFEHQQSKELTQKTFKSKNSQRIYALKSEYIKTIDEVVLFLQGNNPTLAHSICSSDFLPQASRFNQIEDLEYAFGSVSLQDKAKYLATLYIEDLSDFIVEEIDSNFGFSRYAERISSSAHTFDELYQLLKKPNSLISQLTIQKLDEYIKSVNPKMLVVSIPFPGNLVQAFKCGQFVKQNYPHIKIVYGGGFPNTELRSLKDSRVFEFTDFICLDDGEAPLEQIYTYLTQQTKIQTLKRTFVLDNGKVKYINNPVVKDYHQKDVGTPDYSDLRLKEYISVIEVANPMHSLWSDGRWNKMTLAHGCYWAKCTFCDVSLDYIKRYQQTSVTLLCDRIVEIIEQTGQTGFHFVDEAAPPVLMRDLAIEIIKRNLTITWWTNIRFEKRFTNDLCQLLKQSGCIAVSGGVEVASDRLLKLIDKGIDLEQLTHVTHNFTTNGIMVHAYLMYGFPTQTDQETINSLEVVRQLFEYQLINSGFWHQFAMTAHSPIGINPNKFKAISVLKDEGTFANNDRPHIDKQGADHQKYSQGLKTSIYNYMNGAGLDLPLQNWFNFKIKQPTISTHYIENFLENQPLITLNTNTKIVFLHHVPKIETYTVTKKGKNKSMAKLELHTTNHIEVLKGNLKDINNLKKMLDFISIQFHQPKTLKVIEEYYYNLTQQPFDNFIDSLYFKQLKPNGLLFL